MKPRYLKPPGALSISGFIRQLNHCDSTWNRHILSVDILPPIIKHSKLGDPLYTVISTGKSLNFMGDCPASHRDDYQMVVANQPANQPTDQPTI